MVFCCWNPRKPCWCISLVLGSVRICLIWQTVFHFGFYNTLSKNHTRHLSNLLVSTLPKWPSWANMTAFFCSELGSKIWSSFYINPSFVIHRSSMWIIPSFCEGCPQRKSFVLRDYPLRLWTLRHTDKCAKTLLPIQKRMNSSRGGCRFLPTR